MNKLKEILKSLSDTELFAITTELNSETQTDNIVKQLNAKSNVGVLNENEYISDIKAYYSTNGDLESLIERCLIAELVALELSTRLLTINETV